jgi:hypothetical protein
MPLGGLFEEIRALEERSQAPITTVMQTIRPFYTPVTNQPPSINDDPCMPPSPTMEGRLPKPNALLSAAPNLRFQVSDYRFENHELAHFCYLFERFFFFFVPTGASEPSIICDIRMWGLARITCDVFPRWEPAETEAPVPHQEPA